MSHLKSISLKAGAIALCALALFLLFEGISRLVHPEFVNNSHADTVTRGKNMSWVRHGSLLIRRPYWHKPLPLDRKLIVILGDSISNGYGLAYEDIYWVKLQRQLDLRFPKTYTVFAIAQSGNHLADAIARLQNHLITDQNKENISHFIYQFNQNDITSFGKARLRSLAKTHYFYSNWYREVVSFAVRNLFKFNLLSVAQYYTRYLLPSRYGSCESRGIAAMGPYTWAYGHPQFKSESETLWQDFSKELKSLANLSKSVNAPLSVLYTPIVYDIDTDKRHPLQSAKNIDLSCATVDPRSRLKSIANALDIQFIDPTDHLRTGYRARLREGNPTNFYFPDDDNHLTPAAAAYIGEYLAASLKVGTK